ncbi:glycoside hydrolase family 6 protein [Streptomyces sp. CMB-StM0423]|uniref:glycoside hydrolase family 6 protein n=1 Tax=Streptomyces sp. CMB-StM0423 TaxID=2059884 RepID=UPI000C714474|nr:glycoside hydrolase family 6 protein [Streptomyces sp. CMB-StM0423]AUH44549.1 endoglucanase [Streptomyces sp. CMB-StM0423]
MSARIRTLVCVVLLGVALGCPPPAVARDAAGGRVEPAAAAAPLWVDPDSAAARQVREWRRQGRGEDAELLKQIAERPVATWPRWDDPRPDVERAVAGAAAAGRRAVLVAYNIPHRDCGQHSAGGAADAAAYRAWIGAFADAIGDGPALVVLEPDAVAHMVAGCTPPEYHAERLELLSDAVTRLKQHPGAEVYLDAGHSNWIANVADVARSLRSAGVDRADGFALNVSNFQTTESEIGYGRRLSELLDGARFVIDTSRNGNGPLRGGADEAWCNPPGRALGRPPTTRTGVEGVAAYLWIKRPGDSDGTCRGGPPAGRWWPQYALGLARAAAANDGGTPGG